MENSRHKFRVWDKFHEKMTNDVMFQYEMTINEVLSCDEDWVFLQYTGVKDKNGVEIYEGDIVKMYDVGFKIDEIVTVEFKDGVFGTRGEFEFVSLIDALNITEVIGNIYEDSKLLDNDN